MSKNNRTLTLMPFRRYQHTKVRLTTVYAKLTLILFRYYSEK